MPTQHTLVPVGMMGVQTDTGILQSNLQQVYVGIADPPPQPEACNAVHAYQEPSQFPGSKAQKAISQYKNLVEKANIASNGRLTCLVADFTQKKAIDPNTGNSLNYFYDGVYHNLVPNLQTVNDFLLGYDTVVGFIDEIMNNNLTNNVLGWYLADEVKDTCGSPQKPSLTELTDICQKAHDAQVAKQTQRGWPLKPFYIVIPMDANWAADNNSLNFSYVDPWVNAVTNTVGADLVIMIDFYPWLSTAEDFRFSQSPEKEAFRSPLRRWWKFLHDTSANYANNTKVVGVHAVLQAHRMNPDTTPNPDTFRIPSHADMHQQIRAVKCSNS